MKMEEMLAKLKTLRDEGKLSKEVMQSIVDGKSSEFGAVTKHLGLGRKNANLVAKYETKEGRTTASRGKYLNIADWKPAVFAELERAAGASAVEGAEEEKKEEAGGGPAAMEED
jgi:hypothetical protein